MKNKVNALILDADLDLAKKFHLVVVPILPLVKIQSNPDLFEKDFHESSPEVVFLNFNITHREGSFQLMEKLIQSKKAPLFFGYLDSSTPEIVAHAIENGAQDVFTKPFDEALISTKLARHIKNDRVDEGQLQLKPLVPSQPATVSFSFRLLSVDENGLLLRGKHYISKGTRIEFDAPIVGEIFGKPSLSMMFSRTSKCETDDQSYLFYLEPLNATEAHASALRSYIIRKKQS